MVIPVRNFSDYYMEEMSSLSHNKHHLNLQISSFCNANCIFCSEKQNPFKIERPNFRSIEEIEHIMWSIKEEPTCISLTESQGGRVSEGEAILHPYFFSILEKLRQKFPNAVIIFSTNGSMLTEEIVGKLSKFNPIHISLSLPQVS